MADIYGPNLLIVLIVALIVAAGFGFPLWAIIDAASRPTGAFQAVGSSKGTWISLIAVFWLLTGIVGLILAVVYLTSIRPKLQAAIA
jgi:hypothetical protein